MKLVNAVPSASCEGHEEWIGLPELAVREGFELMMSSRLELSTGTEATGFKTIAMVGMAGKLSGVMRVPCDGGTAALMASKMLGPEADKVGPDIEDALGEVCNMVAGNFKN